MRRLQKSLFAFSTALLIAAPALAQDVAETPELDGNATPVAPAPTPTDGSRETFSEMDKDQSIYVVQNRTYSKSGKFELTPIFFTSLNNKFVGHLGAGVVAAYHVVHLAEAHRGKMFGRGLAPAAAVAVEGQRCVPRKRRDAFGLLGRHQSCARNARLRAFFGLCCLVGDRRRGHALRRQLHEFRFAALFIDADLRPALRVVYEFLHAL